MNRFKRAWLAFWGELEPGVREVEVIKEKSVLVGDKVGTIYQASSKKHEMCIRAAMYGSLIPFRTPSFHEKYFSSCADAFAAGGDDAKVDSMAALIVGSKAYRLIDSEGVDIQPKPKRAKGKA